jgi:CheY-like chemotaxis protein
MPVADVGEIRGVWIENKPDLVTGYANAISSYSKVPCKIEVAVNAKQALDLVGSISPDSLVVDIKLDDKIDGISFVRQLRRNRPILPIHFVSSYLDEYEGRLSKLDNIAGTHNRLQLEDEIFAVFRDEVLADAYSHRVFRHYRVESITWQSFLEHDHQELIVAAHARLFSRYVRNILNERGLAWAAICGTKIAASSKSFDRFPGLKEKEALAKRFGSVPFIYTQPILSEEGLGFMDALLDYYPRMIVGVSKDEAVADFDTGTNRTLLPESLTPIEPASVLEPGTHLGKAYWYAVNKRDVSFRSAGEAEAVGPIGMAVAIVKDWKKSPWVAINPERGGLVGRDVFVAGKVKVSIEPRGDRKGVQTKVSSAIPGKRNS